MSELLRLLLSLSLSGGVLTLVTAALNRLLRGRMPIRFLYGLWLLALLRFLCPIGTDGSLAHQAVSQPQAIVVLTIPSQDTQPVQPEEGVIPEPRPNADPPGISAPPLPALLTAVWAAGVLTAAGRRWGGYARLKRRLRADELPVEAWESALLQDLTEGDRRAPRLKRSAAADTPMLAGLFRPVIWLPAGAWNEQDLGYALRHELVHRRRHDLLFKWAAVGTACLHWFNPAAWYLVRAVERDGELSCDEAVARTLSQRDRTGYGELLLRCAMGQAGRAGRLAASLNTQKQDLKARLTIIMRKQPDPKQARRLLAAVVVLLVAVSASVGAYAISAAPEEEPDMKEGAVTLTTPQDDLDIELAVDPQTILTSSDEDLWIAKMTDDTPLALTENEYLETEEGLIYEAAKPSHDPENLPEKSPLAWPFAIDGENPTISLSALFGKRIHPITGAVSEHDGIDIPLEQNTPVLAAAAGVVTESCYDSTLGCYVVLDHGSGITTLYAHMSGDAMPEAGDQVEAGEQIGAVSMTGMATGYHLHFEVSVDGVLRDPLAYLPDFEIKGAALTS